MTGPLDLLRDRVGSAAVELALSAPLLLLIMFGSTELGRFFWSEHQLLKAVRDASVYVSRRPIDDFNCGTSTVSPTVVTNAQNLVRTGALAGGTDRMPHWNDAGASIVLSLSCVNAAGGTTLGGIYTANANQVPVVTINATLPYQLIMRGFGLKRSLTLRATQQGAVMGA